MNAVMNVIDFVRGMGAACMMPIFIIIIGLVVRVKFGELINAALTTGVGFIGLFLMMDLLGAQLGPAAGAMVENWGIQLDVLDVGWSVFGGFAWASDLCPLIFLITIVVNIIMIALGLTRTLNVDVWNYWNFMWVAACVQVVGGSVVVAIICAVITEITCLLIADRYQYLTAAYLPGMSFAHAFTVYWIPLGILLNKIYDKIPGFKDLKADPEYIQQKFGAMGNPLLIGFVLGVGLGLLAKYNIQNAVILGMNMSACMILMPRMIGLLMEGISVIATATQEYAQTSKFLKGKELYIGVDGGILMGRPAVIAMATIMVPLIILIAIIMPGNRVLPMVDLAIVGALWQWAVITANDNVVRGIVSGCIMCALTLVICTWMADVQTAFAVKSGFELSAGVNYIQTMSCGNELVPVALIKLCQFLF